MSDRWQVDTADHDRMDVLADEGHVIIEFGEEGYRRLTCAQAEEFALMFVRACWEAARQPQPSGEVFTYKDGSTIPVVPR